MRSLSTTTVSRQQSPACDRWCPGGAVGVGSCVVEEVKYLLNIKQCSLVCYLGEVFH